MKKLMSKKLKNIIVIGTGGTIAGAGETGVTSSYKSAQVKVDSLIASNPIIASIANVKSINMFDIDSCDMTLDNLLKMAKYINNNSKNDEIDGFVITHGTDTLEETAYFLNLTVKTRKPVVITGSMRPSTAISADGPLNLYQAISLATNEEAYGKGVLVTLADAIYGARDISKVNTFRTEAFSHRDLGCLGYMQDEKVYFYNMSTKTHTIDTEFDISKVEKLPKVDILYFHSDADESLIDFISERSNGIIIAGAGCGRTSEKWNKKINQLTEKGFPIVRSSRVSNGLVSCNEDESQYSVVYSNNLNPQKSRILLSLALSLGCKSNKIQKVFDKY